MAKGARGGGGGKGGGSSRGGGGSKGGSDSKGSGGWPSTKAGQESGSGRTNNPPGTGGRK